MTTTTDQTPDAIRAAIADAIEHETGYDRIHCEQLARKSYEAIAQIGAVPAAGDGILIEPMSVQAMRIRRWAEFAFDHAECPEWDDEDQALYAALGTLANGADDGV